jgi:low affinity Fe/Cu permease
MDSFKFEHFLALLNFIIFLIQVVIRSEIKRLDEKLEYFEDRVKTLENKIYQVKHDNRNN